MSRGFRLDLNKCTGCEACGLACTIENQLPPGRSWRRVETFNPRRHPSAPRFHLSLACNHCAEPPCLDACPALAYRKEAATGAVLLDREKCIGCGYCIWACPFDAPSHDFADGVVSKCTLCHPRLARGADPACVELCPTGALAFGELGEATGSIWPPGFPDDDVGPAIRFFPLRKGRQAPDCSAAVPGSLSLAAERSALPRPSATISLGEEWPLLLFTVAAPLLVGWFIAAVFGTLPIQPAVYLAAALGATGVSSLHLGRKLRAWRAMLNLRRSPLSREIAAWALFLVLAGIGLTVAGEGAGRWAALSGFVALFSIDRVYDLVRDRGRLPLHSADTILSGLLFTGVLLPHAGIMFAVLSIKLVLYALRERPRDPLRVRAGSLPAVLRIGLGMVLPTLIWILGGFAWQGWMVACIAVGEAIDRTEFYIEIETTTPARRMALDLYRLHLGGENGARSGTLGEY